jgi:hypothetical protein
MEIEMDVVVARTFSLRSARPLFSPFFQRSESSVFNINRFVLCNIYTYISLHHIFLYLHIRTPLWTVSVAGLFRLNERSKQYRYDLGSHNRSHLKSSTVSCRECTMYMFSTKIRPKWATPGNLIAPVAISLSCNTATPPCGQAYRINEAQEKAQI